MPHVHQHIRAAVQTVLTGLPSTGVRVYANRVHPLTEAELPAIRLYVESEQAEQALDGQITTRELSIAVEACAKAGTALDDLLDQIGGEIEAALASPVEIAGKPLYLEYDGMKVDFEPGDLPVGVKRLHYRVSYHTAAPDTFI